MNWKLWLMSKIALAPLSSNNRKQDKPRNLPQKLARHLVLKLRHDPDWVRSLEYVCEPKDNATGVFDIRIFSPLEAELNHITINDYASLSSYPDLILFTGWYDKKHNQVMMQEVSIHHRWYP